MDIKTKNELMQLFSQSFKKVVLPKLKQVISELDEVVSGLGTLEKRLEQIDKKLNILLD